MFIRFRKTSCDGFRPQAAADSAARIACRHPVDARWCANGCRMKPRCRWRIDADYKLKPYTMKVYLTENRRVDGKVKQETVAFLGSINATWLDSFWYGIDEKHLEKIRCPDWQRRAIRARVNFWNGAAKRMQKLANRLGPDAKRLRMAVHARIPWPMETERFNLEIMDAEAEAEFWHGFYDGSKRQIESLDRSIEHAREQKAEEVRLGTKHLKFASEWQKKAKELKARRTPVS